MSDEELEPIRRLNRDLKKMAGTMTANEARFLVDAYYQMQQDRIRAAHQVSALEKAGEPNQVLDWLFENTSVLERNIKSALGTYSQGQVVGKWAESIIGIGPVISAGLLAHIDITKAPTAGHIWRFAGLDPTVVWKEKEKRPWNGALKRLAWIVGESFTKQSGHKDDFYGKLYLLRKAQEIERNCTGQNIEQAKVSLATKKWGKDTDALVWYSGRLTGEQGREYFNTSATGRLGLLKKMAGKPGDGLQMLPPARLQLRAQRYAVKIFLSHWQCVAYRHHYGTLPPKPYVIEHLGHAHMIQVPNFPWPEDIK